MKLRERRITENPRLMIIPMIDVIFFLLVFFMMSTMFMVEQKVLPVTLPAATAAQVDPTRTVAVTVLADATLRFGEEPVSLVALETKIRTALSGDRDSRFVLRADRAVAYGRVVEVLDIFRKLNVQRLTVAVEQQP